jgi:hypothetical protein
MRMKTYMFLGKTYAKKYAADASDAMKTLSAKTKKHIKKNKLKYSAGAGAASGYAVAKTNKDK